MPVPGDVLRAVRTQEARQPVVQIVLIAPVDADGAGDQVGHSGVPLPQPRDDGCTLRFEMPRPLSPADVIRKAENLAKAKAVIKEVIRRVELTPEEKEEICEFIKTKAEEEAMALMTPKSAEAKTEDDAA